MSGPSPRIGRRVHDRVELGPGRRLFIAIPVPDEVTHLVADLVERLRAEEAARSSQGTGGTALRDGRRRPGVRWVRMDDLHLTIRFLGPTEEERLPALEQAVSRAAAGEEPFEIGIGGGGAFPSVERPRALWLGVSDPSGGLGGLAAATSTSLAAEGWSPDERPYTPHLTLARTDGVRGGAWMARRLVKAAAELETWFAVERLVLYESHTGGGPARYEALHGARLGGG